MTKKKKRFLATRAVVEAVQWPAQVYLLSWCIIVPFVNHGHFTHCCKNFDCLFNALLPSPYFSVEEPRQVLNNTHLYCGHAIREKNHFHTPHHRPYQNARFDHFKLSVVVAPCSEWLTRKLMMILVHEETVPRVTLESTFPHSYKESWEGNFPLVITYMAV